MSGDNHGHMTRIRHVTTVCHLLFEVCGHEDVVIVDVQFASVCDPLSELAGVGLTEGHNVPRPLHVLYLKHQSGRVHLLCEEIWNISNTLINVCVGAAGVHAVSRGERVRRRVGRMEKRRKGGKGKGN